MRTRHNGSYGRVGLDVGVFGRWSRLLWGMLMLLPFAFELLDTLTGSGNSGSVYVHATLYLVGIAIAYSAVYRLLGERLFSRSNPWINTAILVGPAFLVGWWNPVLFQIVGFNLPHAFVLGMGVYIGASFILQWRIKYGGCEVVALPIVLFKKRYTTYCIPLVALDAAEKQISDRSARQRAKGELQPQREA